jgi:hypothetical protein
MPEIVLTEEQIRLLEGVHAPVDVKDQTGRVVARLDPLPSPEFIAEMKRRAAAPGPRYSAAQVHARLQALDAERARVGPFDKTYVRTFLAGLEQADPATYGPSRPA